MFSRLTGLVKLDSLAISDKDKERVKTNDNVTLTRELIMEYLKA